MSAPAPWLLAIRRAVIATLLLSCFVIVWRYATWPRPSQKLVIGEELFKRHCEITTEAFLPQQDPKNPRRFPAVILLHGIEGGERYRWQRYLTADRLREEGYAVFIVHYFCAVDYPDLWKFKPDGSLDHEAIEQHRLRDQQKWVAGVTCALQHIAERPDVDPRRIAIDGYSLGGFVAISAAQESVTNQRIPNVKCLVVNWAAMFRDVQLSRGFPPSFFVHGGEDQVVLLKYAEQTVAALKNVGAATSLHVVPGGEHMASSPESDRLTLEFLGQHLGDEVNSRSSEAVSP